MSKGSQHVAPNESGEWAVRRSGASRASRVFETQSDAMKYARQVAQKEGSDLYVHGRDGTIRLRDPAPGTDLPEFHPGDTIRVHVKIKEGDKERLQPFEGTVIARKNTGMGETITVRKVSFGQRLDRIFPLSSRAIDHVDVLRTGKVRRAKLYYLRDLKGKAARLRERE